MSDVTKLLEEATPLPWDRAMFASPDGPGWDSDAALIVYAVNRLPDYEAAVDALERLVSDVEYEHGEGEWDTAIAARAALDRLRETVPA